MTGNDRALTTALSHTLTLAITAILIIGIAVSFGSALSSERTSAVREELTSIGNQLASDVAEVDTLAGQGNATVYATYPERILGQRYSVSVTDGGACPTAPSCLALTAAQVDVSVTVPLANRTATDQISLESVAGGRFSVTVNGSEPRPSSTETPGRVGQRVGAGQSVDTSSFASSLGAVNDAPRPAFDYEPKPPVSDETVTFNASGSSDPDGTVDEYLWDFGADGTVDATGKVVDRDLGPGDHEVLLSVGDDDNGTAQISKNLTVGGLEYNDDLDDYNSDPGVDGTMDGISFTVFNNWSSRAQLTAVVIDPENPAIDELMDDDSATDGGEVVLDVGDDGAGHDDDSANEGAYDIDDDAGNDHRSIPASGVLLNVDQPGEDAESTGSLSIGASSAARVYLEELGDVDTDGETMRIGLQYTVDGDNHATVFTDTVGGPQISNYRVESSGGTLYVRFDSSHQLGDIDVAVTGDATKSLQEGDFSETTAGGDYEYEAVVSNSPGSYTAELTTAQTVSGASSMGIPVSASGVLYSPLTWASAAHWNDNGAEQRVVHASFGDHDPGTVTLGYEQTAPDLVGYWTMDGGGGTATDESGAGNDGDLENGPTPVVGLLGTNAYEFDGSSSYIEVDDAEELDGGDGSAFTATAWFQADPNLGDHGGSAIIGKQGGDIDWALEVQDTCESWMGGCSGGSGPYLGFRGDETGWFWWSSSYGQYSGSITDDTWQHAAFAYDEDAEDVRVYIDGALVAEDLAAPDGFTEDTGGDVRIGAFDDYFDGSIDEVRVYEDELSQSEIQDLYTTAFNGSFTTSTKSVGSAINPGPLTLAYDADIPATGTVEVVVHSTAGGGEDSDTITLSDGPGSVDVTGLSSASDEYNLRVTVNTTARTETPEIHSLSLTS